MKNVFEKISLDGKTIILIIACFVIVFLTRQIFGLTPWYIAIPVYVSMFFLSLFRPRAGIFAVVVLTILFERFFTLEGFQFGRDIIKIYPIDIIITGIYTHILFFFLSGKFKNILSKSSFDQYIFIFFFILTTLYFLTSFFGFGEQSVATAFSTWKNYVFYGLFIFIFPIFLNTKENIVVFLKYFFAASMIGIVFLIIGFVRGEGLWTEYTPLSTEGVRFLAFPHAFYFSLAFLSLFVTARFWSSGKYFVLFLITFLFFGIGTVVSLMRHMWIGMVFSLGFAFLFLFDHFHRATALRMTGVIFGCVGLFLTAALFLATLFPTQSLSRTVNDMRFVVVERIISIGNTGDESISWRGSTWKSAMDSIQGKLLFGTGLGLHIPVESGTYRDFVEVRNIHNSWLALLVQMGCVGFFAFALGVFVLWYKLFRLMAQGSFMVGMRNICLTLSVYFFVVFLAQPYLETNLMSIFFWSVLGMTKSILLIAKYEGQKNDKPQSTLIV
ncbi:MAG: O-antigen ligase family protein [Candidatus Moranbacteria bacterium]|nr:O-antigen ligase family protein [Candidatus Moranbacteria bacterium]